MSVSVNEASCLLGKKYILDRVSFRLGDGEKVALVGENGSGKSTLLKCIAGIVSLDDGEIARPKNSTIGYLPQEATLNSGRTLRKELLCVFDDLISAQKELRDLEHRMAEVSPDTREFDKISHRYDFLQSEMIRRGGYQLDSEVGRVSAGLGFSADDLERPCREFSGGWQMRILLASLLLRRPDVLLLDEPTNHLDLETILWLEDWIKKSSSEILMVSHERAFMDNLVSRTFEIHLGSLSIYKGNYTDYLEQREERYEQMRRAHENQQQQINQIRRFIDRNRADKSRAAQVQSRIKQLEKIDPLPLPPSYKTIHFEFPQPDRGNKEVVSLVDCGKSYGSNRVLEPFTLRIYRGDRVALVGLNGAGKSTLMKLLSGSEPPSHGKRVPGSRTVIEYFSQYQHDELNPESTVLDSILEKAPLDVSARARDLLGAFLFSGDDVFKKTGVLSGGEKTQLRLARMLYSKANLLLMDEPTNHLDVSSRATLENALRQYSGTLVFVSHDRVFMDRLANKVVEIHKGGTRMYPGHFTDYIRAKNREVAEGISDSIPFPFLGENLPQSVKKNNGEQETGASDSRKKTKQEKRVEARKRNELHRKKKPVEKQIRFLEQAVVNAEERLKEIDELLQDPKVYTDSDRCATLVREKKTLESDLERDMKLWEEKNLELQSILQQQAPPG